LSVPDAIIAGMTSTLSRQEISDAVTDLGWRLVLGELRTTVPVTTLAEAAALATRIVASCDDTAGLDVDLRSDAILVTLRHPTDGVTARELERAGAISAEVARSGQQTVIAGSGPTVGDQPRAVQAMEIAVDAMDIAAVRPFWRAVLGYVEAPDGSLFDPFGQGAPVWFQQMDEPRVQRNRIHFDVSVPHDEAAARLEATLAAGGVLVSDAAAPAFWIMADVEGNEVCICTWQGRDPA
jgi:4a-hydroxytetrahydrobiopterin dehydratase